MTPTTDVWRAANLLIKQYGIDAEIVAAQQADQMQEQNDLDGHLIWLRIVDALRELQAPPTGLPN